MSQKNLKDMTLAELWELFPIVLAAYNPDWSEWANEEILKLSTLLRDYNPVITHIGSTSIPNIQAKPIIDILIEISPILTGNGFVKRWKQRATSVCRFPIAA